MKIFQSPIFKFVLLILILLACWWLGQIFDIDKGYLENMFGPFPIALSGLVYIFAYVFITFFIWFSKDLFRVVGALIFGAYFSTLFVWIAEFLNACILFSLSRRLGRDFVQRMLPTKVNKEDQRKDMGFWGVFALRMVPLVPFRFLDLGCGLTKVSLKKYMLIVLLASPLRIFWLQFILASVGEVVLKDPMAMQEYFLQHTTVLKLSFAYAMFSILLMIILRWWERRAKV